MKSSFIVECRVHPINLNEPKWCFCCGSFKTVISVGKSIKRWWDTKESLVDELTSLGISDSEYDVNNGVYSHDGLIRRN